MSVNYGLVRITGGEHAGKLGYYDNDEGKDAIVYLEGAELLSADYVIVPLRFLEQVKVTSVDVERFKREHPELARQAGTE
jgi:hypothetical protein